MTDLPQILKMSLMFCLLTANNMLPRGQKKQPVPKKHQHKANILQNEETRGQKEVKMLMRLEKSALRGDFAPMQRWSCLNWTVVIFKSEVIIFAGSQH